MGFISKTLKAMQQKDRQAAQLTAGCMSNIQMWNVPPTQRVDLQPTPVFLPGESQGRRSLVGCRVWGHTESDTTEVT